MAILFHPGADPSRVYYGTDTRLFDLMAGATLAFLAASRRQPNQRARRTLHMVGPAAAVVLGVFWVTAGTAGGLPTNFMFEGGFLLCAALAALVVADARLVEPGWFSRALAWRPLHFIGTISYGIYLWHWPVIVYLNGARTGLSTWPLDLLRIVVTLALSTASYYLVERPIRLARLHGWARFWGAPLAGVVTAVIIVVATIPAVADPSRVVGTTHLPARRGHVVRGHRRLRRASSRSAWPAHRRPATRCASCSSGTRSCTTRPTGSPRRCRRPARPRWPRGPSTASA